VLPNARKKVKKALASDDETKSADKSPLYQESANCSLATSSNDSGDVKVPLNLVLNKLMIDI
jgi:hypothetical protein